MLFSPMSRFLILVPIALTSILTGCQVPPVPVEREGLDRERYTRVNLRPDSTLLRSTNYLSLQGLVPVGSPVKLGFYSKKEIRLTLGELKCTLVPVQGQEFPTAPEAMDAFLDKYFVDTRDAAVKLEVLGPPRFLEGVKRGTPEVGMTKEQVYACLGPPVFVDGDRPVVPLSRAEILASDHWTYARSWLLVVPERVEMYFGLGVLQKQVD